MKKISGVIVALLLVIVTLFGFAGCGSDGQSELQSKIDALQSQIQELEDKLSEMDGHNKELNAKIEEMDGQLHEQDEKIKQLEKELYGSYNEAGGFYEREENDYISAFYDFMVSSIYRYRISVEHDDKNLVFVCSVEVGSLTSKGNTVELKSGEDCHWGFENYMQETWDYPVYVDIIAKKGEQIIGYGVVGFFPLINIPEEEGCKVLKFAIFPKVKGEYQTVGEEQIKRAMDDVKNRNQKEEPKAEVTYNEAGGFYEREENNYIRVYSGELPSLFNYRIWMTHDDENSIFSCSVEYGHLVGIGTSKVIEIKSGSCLWQFETFPHSTEYLDIIVKNQDRIIGYGVIGLFPPKNTPNGECRVLKFAFFPKVNGEYQSVSEDQIKKAMDGIKN